MYRKDGYRPSAAPQGAYAFASRAQAEPVAAALRENETPAKVNEIRIAEAQTECWIYRQDARRGTVVLGWHATE